ncbi:TlpA family protein disulfide reductase [Phreatobacter aquaticus]|uniref:TlpA family protein disulfide reductase n=1 Tax=Phreatobacter aquaticus TaxID=2570229 RepID=A0A4D7QT91_9HYPH|nr:TlpA family protein disulfide reductase [Phreatobacter aquaticus]
MVSSSKGCAVLSRAKAIVLVTGLIGLGAGFAAFYWTGGLSSNPAVAACAAAKPVATAMSPLAHGEVAAFRVTETPALATNLRFKAPDGRDLTLADFRGRTILLNLWATWCAPCRHEMPALDKLQATLGGEKFEVVAINIDTRNPERAETWLRDTGIRNMAHYSDVSGKVFQDLKAVGRAFGMPTTLLIDGNGCELGHISGPAEWASDDALKLIRTALAR